MNQKHNHGNYFPPFCDLCGGRIPELEPTAIACPSCGGDLLPNHIAQSAKAPKTSTPWVSGLLSLLLPGAGQVYNGQFMRGVFIFGTCWLLIPWIFGVIDAFGSARRADLQTQIS